MKKTVFATSFLLICACSLQAQTRIGIGVGLFSEQVAMVTMSSSQPVIHPFVLVDHYLTYRFAFQTGVGYYRVGYSTLGKPIDVTMYGKNLPLDEVDNRWKHSMLQVPVGIRIGPQTFPFNLTLGADINVTLKSTLWDLRSETSTTDYFKTDITKAVRPLNFTPYAMITYMLGSVTFNIRYMYFGGNWYSSEAAVLAEENAKASGSHWRSWYATYGDLLQLYPGVELNVTYRIR